MTAADELPTGQKGRPRPGLALARFLFLSMLLPLSILLPVLPARAQQGPQAAEGAAPPAGETWQIVGTVTTPYGYPVEGALIRSLDGTLSAEGDADGRFELSGRGEAVLGLTVRRAGFVPQVQQVPVRPGQRAELAVQLQVDGEQFREAVERVRLRIYREGAFTPVVWFVPRLGVAARFTRPALHTPQDQLFEMFSTLVITRDALATFPYLHQGSALISEAVTPEEHLFRRYPRGPFLKVMGQSAPSLEEALNWTQQNFEFYRNGASQGREVPGWSRIQQSIDAVRAELFKDDPSAQGLYVPGYGLLFQGVRTADLPPVTSMMVLAMLLTVRVPVPGQEHVFVQIENDEALWALQAPASVLRELVRAGQQNLFQLDDALLKQLEIYRNGIPWGR